MSTLKSDHDSNRSLLKSTSVISLGTLTSRILGFVRDVLLAKLLGTAAAADAFFVAFRIPNLFREMLAEGAANAAVVPVLSEYTAPAQKQELKRIANILFMLFLGVLTAITVVGIVLAPWIVRLMTPGFLPDPEKFKLTVELTRWLFPYLILIGLTAFSIAVLYVQRYFVTAAFGPCLLNVALIGSIGISSQVKHPVYALVGGVLLGGVLQLLFQQIPLWKAGFRFWGQFDFKHPAVTKVAKLLVPRLFGAGVYQLNILLNTLCASLAAWVGPGGIAAIYYADRIIQLPNGVFIAALASVALPALSAQAARQDMDQFRQTLLFALKNVFLVMVPAMVILFCLAEPIIQILFERGEFTAYSTQITGRALTFYALGLIAIGGMKVLVTAFHALQDTATPVKVALGCLALNAVLNFVLMRPLQIGGIALASAIALTINSGILFWQLNRRLGGLAKGLRVLILKVLLAGTGMAVGLWCVWLALHSAPAWVRLLGSAGAGMFIYVGLAWALRIREIRELFQKVAGVSAWT